MSTRDRGWAKPNLCSCPHTTWGQGAPESSQTQRQKVPLGGPTKGSGAETRLRAEEAARTWVWLALLWAALLLRAGTSRLG